MTIIDPSTIVGILQDSLAKGQTPRLTVTSNSMAPLFRADDQIVLEAAQPEQLHSDDIVTIIDSNGLVTHRIWARHDKGFITRGDHALNFDEIYPPEVILGRVVGRTHKQHTLSFQTGLGQWLDQYLATLSHREYRWLTGSQEVPFTEFEPGNINTRKKTIHYLFYGWAILITFVVNLATRIKPGETKI